MILALVPRTLSFKNGHRIIRLPRFGIGQTYKQDIQLAEDERELLTDFPPELIYGKVRVQESYKFVPAMVFYDKKILRFDGYFKQIIYESPLESYRIRRVIIYYYLEDDTIAIYETPYKNSALNQGMRVRRHRISKNDQNEPYNWRDLNLRQNLLIYGIIYRLCDCDAFTREWLESEGIEVKCSEPIPTDPYMLKLIEKDEIEKQRSNSYDLDGSVKKEQNSNEARRKMIDGKVLKFYAVFDDQRQQCNMIRKFIIFLYLIDNTIEIREIHHRNNGYDPLPIYLHRQVVPRDSSYNIRSFVNLFLDKCEQDKICYLTSKDFILGQQITIFNRTFFLYDCDTFTRTFCQFDCKPLISLAPIVPLHVVSSKFEQNENHLLCYEAIMESSYDNDRCRQFNIVYQLDNDLISVYEKSFDGREYSTRKFFERSRIPKPDSHSIYYGLNDFYIGARVEFYKHRFIIINADRSVWKFIEDNQQLFSSDVIDSFRKNAHLYKTNIQNQNNLLFE
ncbi:hypothetical protein I4U23_029402 [Adineta vaga]|nr:hypothetical protein I4U23_029402 [Adineta vaga]